VRAVASAEPSDALDGSQGYTGERVGAIAYNPALDGIRALAVLAVLLFHENWGRHDTSGLIPGGFIGVDMFFVLSGFLITALLLRDHAERGRVVSVDFWARRVRRLLPALLVLVGLVSLYAAFVAAPHQLGSIKRQGISALFYVENWAAITSRQASLSPFSHLWSLSVEEQWYLVWPLMLGGLLALTRGRVRHLLVWIGLLAAGSFVLMIVLFETVSYHRATAGTDTRAWQLLLGSGLAVVVVRGRGVVARSRATRIVIEVAAAVSLLFLVWVATQVSVSDRWPYDGGLILVGLATIVLVVAALQPQRGVAASLLSWPPLVWIGLISYGLYLYHLVVYVWLSPERVGVEGAGLLVLRLAVVFGLAATSYLLIERPIRRGTARIKAAPVVAVASFLGAVGLLLVATVGAEPPPLSALTLDHYRALAATTPPGATRVLVVGGRLGAAGALAGGPRRDPRHDRKRLHDRGWHAGCRAEADRGGRMPTLAAGIPRGPRHLPSRRRGPHDRHDRGLRSGGRRAVPASRRRGAGASPASAPRAAASTRDARRPPTGAAHGALCRARPGSWRRLRDHARRSRACRVGESDLA